MRTVIVTLTILLLGSLIMIVWQYEQLQALNDNRFFDYEYRPFSNSIVTKWKRDGKVESIGFDLNDDRELDSLVAYGKGQLITTIWVDKDFNGIYEIEYLYSSEEELIARYDDHLQSGQFLHFTRYTRDSLFRYEDENENGWFEETELYHKGSRNDPNASIE